MYINREREGEKEGEGEKFNIRIYMKYFAMSRNLLKIY